MDTYKTIAETIRKKLLHASTVVANENIVVGFDGFIDKIYKTVKVKHPKQNELFQTISGFADRIAMAAGKSALIQLELRDTKLGGNAPIMANALAKLGFNTWCIGTFGYPDIAPVFGLMHKNCRIVSVAKPAQTNALEFNDGKIMLSDLDAFENLTWDKLKNKVGKSQLINILAKAQTIALVDWSNLPHCSEIWKGISEEIIPQLPDAKPAIFFDIADPSKPEDQIKEMLQIIAGFSGCANTTLGLNENEALKLYCIIQKARN